MAANRIKGITVEIGGDTTKLQTALKGVNTEIRNTQSQLKDVEKLLKLDPGNTELMAQKHRLLGQAVSETKEKLETLKTAAEQANDALARGEISQSQYDALQREIIETENNLRDLERQAGQSAVALQKIAATGEKLKTVGSAIEGVGQKLMPVTAAVGGLGAAAVKVASDFDSAMSQVAAVSGATGKDLEALRDKAREMGSKTKFSASEAAEAMNYMAMAGWKTNDMLSGIEGIMNLAAASGEDLATTSDIVTDALTALGLSAEDSGHFADILAAASSNANTNVSMMGETFKYCAPVAGALGFSAEDTAEAIGLMANAGIKSSQAGTAMRSMMTNLTGEVKFVGDAFGELTIQTTNTDGSMRSLGDILADCRAAFAQMSESEKAANAEALVGKNAMSGFLAVMNAAPGDIEKLNNAINNCDGTAEKMAATMQDNLAGQLTILKSQLEELAISIGEILMPYIRQIVGWIQGLVDWLNSLDEGTKKIIVTVALVAAALGPVLIVIGKVVGAIGTIMTVVPQIASAISGVIAFVSGTVIPAISAVVAAIGWVPLAIAAVVAILVVLYNKCEWFRDAVNAIWTQIKEFFVSAWEVICSFFTETIPNAWNSLVSFFQGIPAWWSGLWQSVGDFFSNIWTNMMNNPVLTGIVDMIRSLWENLSTTLQGIWNGIKTAASGAWELIKNVVLGPVLLLIDLVTGNFTKLKEDAANIWNNIKNAASNIWNGIKQVVGSLAQGLVNHVSILFNGLKTTIANIWTAIKNTASSAWNGLKNLVSSIASNLKQAAVNAFKAMVSGIRSALSSLGSVVQSGFQSAVSFITSLPGKALEWGKDFINGIADGIRSAIGNVINAVSDVADKIRSFLHFSVPDEGPLTDYESWMPDFMSGLAKGIEKSRGMVKKAVSGVASDLMLQPQATVQGMQGGRDSSGDSSVGELLGGLREMLSGLQEMAGGGTICIPVYVGGTLLDEVVVDAQARQNLRSGGR
ncbi:phage tail tape measure protein, TP901 family, core region [Eubacterium sp. 14-2]|uniref:phage tail tape measure protein n=1 Tax=Eubacterium sp. 14-2 TaxID=1235790 RepID=UPI000336E877|nr:phage tail tape measure protein [Eubacterium sp. 14-2]EOT26776.1 phage tail tape measure protein, TP901 family, core region [Eubacterium sp. 14-2]